MGCPILRESQAYKFTEEGLQHLTHCYHDYERPICRHGGPCNAHQRLVFGGTRLDDRCHEVLYQHPPRQRTRSASVPEGFNPFEAHQVDKNDGYAMCAHEKGACRPVRIKRGTHGTEYPVVVPHDGPSAHDDHVEALIAEVRRNNCGRVLVSPDGGNLVEIARTYRDHPFHMSIGRPLNDGELLALVLYTGSDCQEEMTKTQLQDDYDTWRVFDFCLSMAIGILSWHSKSQEVPLYTGLANVAVPPSLCHPKGEDFKGYHFTSRALFFKCHTSASTKRIVAEEFRGDKGVLITIPPQSHFGHSSARVTFGGMAPVAWISKFGDNEAEVLFSRFTWYPLVLTETSFVNGRQELTGYYCWQNEEADESEEKAKSKRIRSS